MHSVVSWSCWLTVFLPPCGIMMPCLALRKEPYSHGPGAGSRACPRHLLRLCSLLFLFFWAIANSPKPSFFILTSNPSLLSSPNQSNRQVTLVRIGNWKLVFWNERCKSHDQCKVYMKRWRGHSSRNRITRLKTLLKMIWDNISKPYYVIAMIFKAWSIDPWGCLGSSQEFMRAKLFS